jgi:hypothetical protein
VNRSELVAAAQREGIRSAAFSLDGGLPPERYVLSLEEGGWSVYYSERGLRREESHFDTEDEACSYLLLRLIEDPTTRERGNSSEHGGRG